MSQKVKLIVSPEHASLKILYTLLSVQFHKEEVLGKHRRVALALFLTVLESTTPLPPFLDQDWCTPDLAAEFVQVAFEGGALALEYDDTHLVLSEHVCCLAKFPPTMNEAFDYAAAKRLFDRPIERLHCGDDDVFNSYSHLPVIISALITGLPSSKLDPQICQNFLEYLHEPDVLLAICALTIATDSRQPLYDLARLRPNDVAWPVCLQRLQEYAYPTWLSNHYNIPNILADLTTFLEEGGVGPSGRTTPSVTEQIAQRDDRPLVNSPKDPWQKAWHRVRQYFTKDTAHEDMVLSNLDTV
ncbi:uncharacterized protein EV420DRAFT_1636312 [Desarmillaria tabescens]|uniref:Uncharacterized protein n=1 Tax=Armillaria tabescens TaxID=1929756 RepID=A0AA39NKP4_ARMTA|nr:uncharacterized protein EV420DRAFT_1636312 [Desarmillaria tabescens]KAK0467299.1 hypothetical protein EV420DRAFT_1636312 [Desarmillaria tabescens]